LDSVVDGEVRRGSAELVGVASTIAARGGNRERQSECC
jgi:hypothetical protein